MTRWREKLVAGLSIAFGAMWLVAAATKASAPLESYEFTSYVAAPGWPAKALVVAAVAGEAALGAAMCLRAVRGLGWSLAALAAAEAALLVARHRAAGELLRCGCFGGLAASTVEEALLRNGILAAVHVAGIVVALTARRPHGAEIEQPSPRDGPLPRA